MANVYERLAALRPADTNEAELYAVAADVYIVATLLICNQSGVETTFRVALTDASGAATDEDWISYDTNIQGNVTHRMIIPAGDGDTIRIKSGTGDVLSFVLTGLKIS